MTDHLSRSMFGAVLAFCFVLPAFGEDAAPGPDEHYQVYEITRKLGLSMFLEGLQEDGAGMRISSILEACGYEGIARTLESKLKHQTFEAILQKQVSSGVFRDLPDYSMLSAQTSASSLMAGYQLGFRAALSIALSIQTAKKTICDAALRSGNQMLRGTNVR